MGCQFLKSLGRGYLSEQSHQKKGEKVSILEKFRKRLFVRTVPPKKGEKVSILEKFRKRLFVGTVPRKKRRKSVKYLKKIRKSLFVGTVPQKKEKKCQFLKSLGRG